MTKTQVYEEDKKEIFSARIVSFDLQNWNGVRQNLRWWTLRIARKLLSSALPVFPMYLLNHLPACWWIFCRKEMPECWFAASETFLTANTNWPCRPCTRSWCRLWKLSCFQPRPVSALSPPLWSETSSDTTATSLLLCLLKFHNTSRITNALRASVPDHFWHRGQ